MWVRGVEQDQGRGKKVAQVKENGIGKGGLVP